MQTRRRPRGTKVIASVIATLMVAFGIGALALAVATGSDPSASTTTLAPLSDDAQELLTLLDRREEATYHAKYEASSAEVDAIVLETWQVPPRARQDSEVSSDGQLLRTRTLVLPEGQVRCVQVDPSPWSCRRGAGDGASPADPLAGFRDRLRDGTVVARDASIDGRAVRCFELTTSEGTSELCALPDNGIPVRVTAADSQLQLVELDSDAVGEDHFEAPTEVSQT